MDDGFPVRMTEGYGETAESILKWNLVILAWVGGELITLPEHCKKQQNIHQQIQLHFNLQQHFEHIIFLFQIFETFSRSVETFLSKIMHLKHKQTLQCDILTLKWVTFTRRLFATNANISLKGWQPWRISCHIRVSFQRSFKKFVKVYSMVSRTVKSYLKTE